MSLSVGLGQRQQKLSQFLHGVLPCGPKVSASGSLVIREPLAPTSHMLPYGSRREMGALKTANSEDKWRSRKSVL